MKCEEFHRICCDDDILTQSRGLRAAVIGHYFAHYFACQPCHVWLNESGQAELEAVPEEVIEQWKTETIETCTKDFTDQEYLDVLTQARSL